MKNSIEKREEGFNMHNYSIASHKRETVTIVIFFGAVFCEFIIKKQGFDIIIANWIAGLAGVQAEEMLNMAVGAATPISIYWMLRSLYVYIIWKWHFFYRWHKIPDFSGVWIGTVRSPLKKGTHQITVKVRQNWDKILIVTSTKNSQAVSSQAEIEVNDNNGIILHYSYSCERNGKCYKGFNSLNYDYGHKIEGSYFTDKEIDFRINGVECTNSRIRINRNTRIKNNQHLSYIVKKGMGSKGWITAERYH